MKKLFLMFSITTLFMGCSSSEEDPNAELEKKWDNVLGTWVVKEIITYDGISKNPDPECDGKELIVTFLKNGNSINYNYYDFMCTQSNVTNSQCMLYSDGKFNPDVSNLLKNHRVISLTKNRIITESTSDLDEHISIKYNYKKLIFYRK